MASKNPEKQNIGQETEGVKAARPEPSVGLQRAREKAIRKRLEEGADLTESQKEFYEKYMNDETVLDEPVSPGESETMVNSASETKTDLGKEQKLGAKGFMELPEQERRRRYKEMKEAEEKEKQEAMAAARAKVESSYKGKASPAAPSMEELGGRLAAGQENLRREVLREQKEREKAKRAEESKAAKEHREPEAQKQEPPPREAIKSLFAEKREIESRLSKSEDKAEKEKLQKEKQGLSARIIEQASNLDEFKDIKNQIEQEQEREWEKGIAASGYKNMDNYKRWHENLYYDQAIKGSNLSQEQKEAILRNGSIIVSNWPKTIELEKEDVVVALKMGMDISQIKGDKWWNPFSRKIQAGDKIFDNVEQFNNYLKKGKAEKIDSEISERMQQRKQEIIEKSSGPIIDNKIRKIIEAISRSETAQSPKGIAEASAAERLKELGKIRSDWQKAREIHSALKDKNWKIKTQDGRLIIGSEAKAQMEQKFTELSEDIIKAASQTTGRNLKREALKATGYKLDKDPEKQKEYRKWLTDEVQKIFDEQKGKIETETGKKVIVAKKAEKSRLITGENEPKANPQPLYIPEHYGEPKGPTIKKADAKIEAEKREEERRRKEEESKIKFRDRRGKGFEEIPILGDKNLEDKAKPRQTQKLEIEQNVGQRRSPQEIEAMRQIREETERKRGKKTNSETALETAQEPEAPKPENLQKEPEKQETKEQEVQTLEGYKIGQKVDIVFPDLEKPGLYITDKDSVFKGVKEFEGEKIVMLEKNGIQYSMLLDLFLETQKKRTLAQDPDELTRDLPDFPGLVKRPEKPKPKRPESIKGPEFPEGFRKKIKKGAKLKPLIKRGKKQE